MFSRICNYYLVHTANESVLAILDKIENGNQSAMARRTGIPQPTIGRIKSGRTMPDLSNLESIARAYGFELWQLLVKGFDPKCPPALRYASQAEEMLYKKFKELQAEIARMN